MDCGVRTTINCTKRFPTTKTLQYEGLQRLGPFVEITRINNTQRKTWQNNMNFIFSYSHFFLLVSPGGLYQHFITLNPCIYSPVHPLQRNEIVTVSKCSLRSMEYELRHYRQFIIQLWQEMKGTKIAYQGWALWS